MFNLLIVNRGRARSVGPQRYAHKNAHKESFGKPKKTRSSENLWGRGPRRIFAPEPVKHRFLEGVRARSTPDPSVPRAAAGAALSNSGRAIATPRAERIRTASGLVEGDKTNNTGGKKTPSSTPLTDDRFVFRGGAVGPSRGLLVGVVSCGPTISRLSGGQRAA